MSDASRIAMENPTMSGICPITHLRSVALETPSFAESVAFYRQFLDIADPPGPSEDGFQMTRSADEPPMLALHPGPSARIRSVTFGVPSSRILEQTLDRLQMQGVAVRASPDIGPKGIDHVTITGPEELPIILRVDTPPSAATERMDHRPMFLSHAVFNAADPVRMRDFFVEFLGFTVSDWYEGGHLTFLRCDQPQHHCIGITPGGGLSLHHAAFDCGSVDGVMRSIARMRKAGHEPLWGPGRHGPGGNIFCYFADPSGLVAEFTSDLIQIADTDAWHAHEWPRIPDNANQWQTGGPSPDAIALFQGRSNHAKGSARA
jgi:catechol 2,3-dioxygenase-like lactoylglutathione lyase family enzyme